MFESDDWDLDQDFLSDVNDKVKDFPQIEKQNVQAKRRKVDFTDSFSSSNNDIDWCKLNNASGNITKCDKNKGLRKNLVLSMFTKSLVDKNGSKSTPMDSKKSNDNNLIKSYSSNVQNCGNNQLPRKNLVLGILQNSNTQDKVMEDTTNSKLQGKVEFKITSNGNSVQKQEFVLQNNKVTFQIRKNNFQQRSISGTNMQTSSKSLEKQLLHDMSKQESITNVELKNNVTKNVCMNKPPQIHLNEKMTLIRRFPGPAGLLPDNIDVNIAPISYLKSLEENEEIKESTDTNFPKYCSQNTKSLFTEGAWQLMLNDLPNDFLEGFEIANIKQMANSKKCYSIKVGFLAGIVENIDHSHENPPIVLKDFTDNIHGIIHRDILLKYPGLIEPNVVILLHDVGLLKTSGSFTLNKYHILISPSNLLAIYSNDGKIEHTHYMELVQQTLTKGVEQSSETCSKLKTLHANDVNETTNIIKDMKNFITKGASTSTNLNATFDNTNELIDFDAVDDFSFSISPNKITNSTNEKIFNCPISKNFKYTNKENKQKITENFSEKEEENVQNDTKIKSQNLLRNLRFSPNTNVKKLSHNSKTSEMDVDYPVSTSAYTEEVKLRMLSNTSSEKINIKQYNMNASQDAKEPVIKELHLSCKNKIENVQLNDKERNKISVRSKLMQFKNADKLTPPPNSESSELSNLKKNNEMFQSVKSLKSQNSSYGILCNAENDSDDEMLSQLDMDTIFSNYNNKN